MKNQVEPEAPLLSIADHRAIEALLGELEAGTVTFEDLMAEATLALQECDFSGTVHPAINELAEVY